MKHWSLDFSNTNLSYDEFFNMRTFYLQINNTKIQRLMSLNNVNSSISFIFIIAIYIRYADDSTTVLLEGDTEKTDFQISCIKLTSLSSSKPSWLNEFRTIAVLEGSFIESKILVQYLVELAMGLLATNIGP